MYSLVIKNARVIDGRSDKSEILDVAVEGDKIIAIDKEISTRAQTTIDATGKILAPGFIDIQNHSDSYWQIFDNPNLDSLITQGFTTILVGQCGASLAPLLSPDGLLAMQKWHNLEGSNINWQSFEEFTRELFRRKFSCNIGSLVGYSTLRRALVGDQVRGLDKQELDILKNSLQESLEAGAFGLSSGLSYAHEIIISELELFELAKIVSKAGALFSLHLRSEGNEVSEAIQEAIDIARHTELNLKISHLKIRNEQNWVKLPEILEQLDIAYHQGVRVHFDCYPYDTTWQPLYAYLPKWAVEGGRNIMIRHFTDPVQKNKILTYLNNSGVKFPGMRIASTSNKLNVAGKTISQIAKSMETSSEQAVLNIIENGGSGVLVFDKNLSMDQVEQLAFHPLSLIASDGAGYSAELKHTLVHPRCFGAASTFLSWVNSKKTITMEQAIKKLTSGPAKKIGLKERGEIAVNNFADLVVFDPAIISSPASYENPYQFSKGIDYVFVNGRAVVTNGKPTGHLPGHVLKKSY